LRRMYVGTELLRALDSSLGRGRWRGRCHSEITARHIEFAQLLPLWVLKILEVLFARNLSEGPLTEEAAGCLLRPLFSQVACVVELVVGEWSLVLGCCGSGSF